MNNIKKTAMIIIIIITEIRKDYCINLSKKIFRVSIETSDIDNIFLQGLDCKGLLMGKLKRKLNFHANA